MEFKLRDLCSVITKGTTPSTLGFEFVDNGINYIKSEQLVNSRNLDYSNKYFINDEAHSLLKRSQLYENDILISIAGAYLGKIAYITKNDLPANTNQAVGIIRVSNKEVNQLYLFYYLSSKKINNRICSYNSQSAQPNINLAQLGSLPILVPNISLQNHIVNTISFLLLKSL